MTSRDEIPAEPGSHFWDSLPKPLSGLPAIATGVGLTAIVTLAGLIVTAWLPSHGVAMLYILAIVSGAVFFGVLSGLSAATASFLAYNFFFLTPTYTFSIADPRDLLALLVFFGVAAATGSLAGRLREVAESARSRNLSLRSLSGLAARLSGALSYEAVAEALSSEAAKLCQGSAAVFKLNGEDLTLCAGTSEAPEFTTADWQAAQRCLKTRQVVYPAAAGWPGPVFEFHPMTARGTATGVLAIHRQDPASAEHDETLRAMSQHVAIALERIELDAEKAAVQKEAENERLRSALLSSISHDIKTPLASIQGAVTSLRQLGGKMPEETRADLLLAIEEETARLSRFVTNLLDMTRLESGPPDMTRDWIDLQDVISASLTRTRRLIPTANLRSMTGSSPAIIRGDETLLQHVLVNVLENAVRYSAPGAAVDVTLQQSGDDYMVCIDDRGPGIEADELPRVFDKFFRGSAGSRAGGTGLGLTICKQIMQHMGGTIAVESPLADGQGTRVRLCFHKAESSLVPELEETST